jgi:hypothetical protein
MAKYYFKRRVIYTNRIFTTPLIPLEFSLGMDFRDPYSTVAEVFFFLAFFSIYFRLPVRKF